MGPQWSAYLLLFCFVSSQFATTGEAAPSKRGCSKIKYKFTSLILECLDWKPFGLMYILRSPTEDVEDLQEDSNFKGGNYSPGQHSWLKNTQKPNYRVSKTLMKHFGPSRGPGL